MQKTMLVAMRLLLVAAFALGLLLSGSDLGPGRVAGAGPGGRPRLSPADQAAALAAMNALPALQSADERTGNRQRVLDVWGTTGWAVGELGLVGRRGAPVPSGGSAVIAWRGSDGRWHAAAKGDPVFNQRLALIPDQYLDPEAKALLLVPTESASALGASSGIYRLPFACNADAYVTWIHTDSGQVYDVDFFIYSQDIVAARDGWIAQIVESHYECCATSVCAPCNNYVVIDHGDGEHSYYLHLKQWSVPDHLYVGAFVGQGEKIGEQGDVGWTSGSDRVQAACNGNSSNDDWLCGVHLHFGVHLGPYWSSYTVQPRFQDVYDRYGTWFLSSGQIYRSGNCEEPPSWHVEYFRDRHLGSRCLDGYESSTYLFKEWGEGAPVANCPADGWSARFTRQVDFQGGSYAFHLEHDDGARFYVDGQEVVNAWWDGAGGHDGVRDLSGPHEVKVEFYDGGGFAGLGAWWYGAGALPDAPAADPDQWRAEYYGNRELWGRPALVQNEGGGSLYHVWGGSGPGYDLPADGFSARWQRTVSFAAGRHRFWILVDDGGKLWVDDRLLIDQWQNQGPAEASADVDLGPGAHATRLEYREDTGSAAARVWWEMLEPYCALVTTASPAGAGSVGLSPTPDCLDGTHYRAGATVTLTASANPGFTFSSWSGGAGGSANPTSVTMDGDRSVTARFAGPYGVFLPLILQNPG